LPFHRRVLDVTTGAVGARGHQHVDACGGIHRHGGGTLAGFVVGMSMDSQESKRL
jgi:hypothetical protein